jgi:hypothetical protein
VLWFSDVPCLQIRPVHETVLQLNTL